MRRSMIVPVVVVVVSTREGFVNAATRWCVGVLTVPPSVTSTGSSSSASSRFVLHPGLALLNCLLEPFMELRSFSFGHRLEGGMMAGTTHQAITRLVPSVVGDNRCPIAGRKNKTGLLGIRTVPTELWNVVWAFHAP